MDIVDWLRSGIMVLWGDKPSRLHEAADEIERLREILLKIKQESNDDHIRAWAHQALQQKESE